MDRFVIREPVVDVVAYPATAQQIVQYAPNTSGRNTNPDIMYCNDLYGNEYMGIQYGGNNSGFQNVMNANRAYPQVPQHRLTMSIPSGSGQTISGIDKNYLAGVAGYSNNNATFIAGAPRSTNPGEGYMSHNTIPHTIVAGEYQNRNFNGPERVKSKTFATSPWNIPKYEVHQHDAMRASPQPSTSFTPNVTNTIDIRGPSKSNESSKHVQLADASIEKKQPTDVDLKKSEDEDSKFVTKADKLKALHKSGTRAFSGTIEKVLKWHKSLQEIGAVFTGYLYEIVAKCVNIRANGLGCKHILIRDESGPAMQVVYYETDFLLPELKPPCTIRVIGRMLVGTCTLQAFSVRSANGDDVSTQPRKAAVAAHYVAKLYKDIGNDTQ